MNQRIQQLSNQANEWASKEESYKSHSQLFTEKFAELIVRECGKSANEWYQNHDEIHSDPMSYVLAHFGVEE